MDNVIMGLCTDASLEKVLSEFFFPRLTTGTVAANNLAVFNDFAITNWKFKSLECLSPSFKQVVVPKRFLMCELNLDTAQYRGCSKRYKITRLRYKRSKFETREHSGGAQQEDCNSTQATNETPDRSANVATRKKYWTGFSSLFPAAHGNGIRDRNWIAAPARFSLGESSVREREVRKGGGGCSEEEGVGGSFFFLLCYYYPHNRTFNANKTL
ncbi:hypothetical protein CDAR_92851 [Caerostris darwini]|uniref:Uncharacterized protein n=1 Tax=Caerostris darwini TaxID=1538125 RepID=A0AAV4PKY7_9ARAC|nr:hypothetical protein CDAR_92851 [Caerostris darwini]